MSQLEMDRVVQIWRASVPDKRPFWRRLLASLRVKLRGRAIWITGGTEF